MIYIYNLLNNKIKNQIFKYKLNYINSKFNLLLMIKVILIFQHIRMV